MTFRGLVVREGGAFMGTLPVACSGAIKFTGSNALTFANAATPGGDFSCIVTELEFPGIFDTLAFAGGVFPVGCSGGDPVGRGGICTVTTEPDFPGVASLTSRSNHALVGC